MTHSTRVLSIQDTRLLLDGRPFGFQGLSFFNALFNPIFNQSAAERLRWLRAFRDTGISALRVWCQWDLPTGRPYVDVAPDATLYTPEGDIRAAPFQRLADLLLAADGLGMVIEVVLFCQEKRENLPIPAQERAVRQITERLKPYRNLILQIWNEKSVEVARYFHAAKEVDPARIVTNSPGVANHLGDEEQNLLLDALTPHTVRGSVERFWEVAPGQIASLLQQYQKPVIDDEPARNGLVQFGGIPGGTQPWQHIEQIRRVRALGGLSHLSPRYVPERLRPPGHAPNRYPAARLAVPLRGVCVPKEEHALVKDHHRFGSCLNPRYHSPINQWRSSWKSSKAGKNKALPSPRRMRARSRFSWPRIATTCPN